MTGVHASTTTGPTTTVSTQIREHTPPILDGTKEHAPAWPQHVSAVDGEGGIDGHGVLVLQGWPPAPDKEEDGVHPKPFFVFLFLFLIFLPLPQAVTRALPFKAIKG
jgi:hypothetical protein